MEYYLYMLRCEDNSIYTGIAKDYIKRYEEHLNGIGAKYTKVFRPKKIERVFICLNRSEASIIEYFFKSKLKKEKEILLKNPLKLIEIACKEKKIKIFKIL